MKRKKSYFQIGTNITKWLHHIEKISLNCLDKFKIFNLTTRTYIMYLFILSKISILEIYIIN